MSELDDIEDLLIPRKDQMKEYIRDLERENERLRAHVVTDNSATLKNALAEIERLRDILADNEAVAADRQQAWLAAWDAEWRAQRDETNSEKWMAEAFRADAYSSSLRAMLERAARVLRGLAAVTDDMARTGLVLGRTDTDSRLRDAGFLLAEIEGVGE